MTLNERLQEAFDKRVGGTAMLPASELLSAMSAIEQLEETIAQQAEAIEKLRDHIELSLEFCDEEGFCVRDNLENALAIQPSPEILQNAGRLMFELQEQPEQQAEAIRLKDAALDWCIGEFNLRLDDIDLSQETISVLSARHIQHSPEILQARDERVAEAITKYLRAVGVLSYKGTALQGIISGEWRKYL